MTNDNPTVVKATPLEQRPAENPGLGGDMFAQHEGQLNGFLSAEDTAAHRARQASRARAMAVTLFAAAILFFAITIVKIGA